MFGIWNGIEKRFVFGIKADTKEKALADFKQKTDRNTYSKWRYTVKEIPKDFVNPKNPTKY